MKILIGRKERKSNTTRYAIRGGNESVFKTDFHVTQRMILSPIVYAIYCKDGVPGHMQFHT